VADQRNGLSVQQLSTPDSVGAISTIRVQPRQHPNQFNDKFDGIEVDALHILMVAACEPGARQTFIR
jgi:hypothetical protein